jgi:hypothetical protein
MFAALSQPDADRFTIFIDALIESPRFNFSAFCQSARISAAEALTWFRRPDIESALQSCMEFIQYSSRIRHAVLDTNAMGALGQILKTSENQVELRRVATTIISRHKVDLRASSRATVTAVRATADSASRDTDRGSERSVRTPAARSMAAPNTDFPTAQSANHAPKVNSERCADNLTPSSSSLISEISNLKSSSAPSCSHSATPPLCHSVTSSACSSALTLSLLAEAQQLRKSPSPREPHSARTLLTRAGSTRSRDHP